MRRDWSTFSLDLVSASQWSLRVNPNCRLQRIETTAQNNEHLTRKLHLQYAKFKWGCWSNLIQWLSSHIFYPAKEGAQWSRGDSGNGAGELPGT